MRDQRGGHNRKFVDEEFFKVWSAKMAYVLGFMFADGSLIDSNYSSRTYYLSFVNNDLELLKQIRSAMKSEHKIYTKPSHIMQHKKKRYRAKEGYVFRFGNKNMYQDLINLGMTHRKSLSMQLPNIPNEYFFYFLRGYFDGDGCINTYRAKDRKYVRLSLIFTSGGTDFLNELAHKISEILLMPVARCYESREAYNLIYRGKNALLILEKIYSNLKSAPILTRKYNKYQKFVNEEVGPRLQLWLARRDLDRPEYLLGALPTS